MFEFVGSDYGNGKLGIQVEENYYADEQIWEDSGGWNKQFSKTGSEDLNLNKLMREQNKPNITKSEILSLKLGALNVTCKVQSGFFTGNLATLDLSEKR